MILPLLGGILLDSIGVRMGLMFFCAVLTLGQFIFMLGGFSASYQEMIIGRVVDENVSSITKIIMRMTLEIKVLERTGVKILINFQGQF